MPPPLPIKRVTGRTLADSMVDRIRTAIVDGSFSPGQKLPSESVIGAQYGVSRTVVREAISRLGAAGLVETHQGRGSYVLTRPSEDAFRIDSELMMSVAERIEILEFRLGCETETAILAATRADDAQRADIRVALSRFRAAGGNPHRAIEADFRFHIAIAGASNNRHFFELLSSLGPTMIAMPRTRLEPTDEPGSVAAQGRALHEHEAIEAAIARRDAVDAGAAMRTHLVNSRERLRRGPS